MNMNMNNNRIHNPLRVVLKHSAIAVAVAVIASSGTARATNIYNFTGGIANVSGYYPGPDNGQYNAGAEGFTPHVSGIWSGFLDDNYGPPLYFGYDTRFTLTADPGYTVTLQDFDFGQDAGLSSFTVLDSDDNPLATVSGVTSGSMADFAWPALTDTQLTIVFGTTVEDYTWINNITFSEQAIVPATITAFGPGAVIDQGTKTIDWTVPYGTDLATLTPTLKVSSGTCVPASGDTPVLDVNNQATYTVTDEAIVNPYTLTVTVTPASSQKDILSFGPYAVISGTDIAWTVPFGSDVTNLAPTYTVSTFASPDATYPSGTLRNFTSPQTYTITAQDGSTQVYSVAVTVAPDETTVIWNIAGGGAWNSGTPNWLGQISGDPTIFSNGDNVIFDKTDGGTITIAADMEPLTTTVSATSGTYSFSGGPLAGTGTLTKSGDGTLSINANNTYTGGTVINAGQLTMNTQMDGALGTGPITLNGGTLRLEWITTANPLISNGGKIHSEGGNGCTLSGPVTLNSNLTVLVASYDRITFGGNISGAGSLILEGNGDPPETYNGVILAGTNTYSGGTHLISYALLTCSVSTALCSGPLSIDTGAKLQLNFTGSKTVASLTLGGVAKTTPGTYGSVASGADFQDDTYFTTDSTGTVTVAGGSYADWATLYAGGASAPAGDDFNGDGVQNGVAFFMGMNGLGTLPGVVGNSVTWPYVNAVTSYKVQTSTDLGVSGWTDVDPGDPKLHVTAPGPGGSVSYDLLPPAEGQDRLFVRLLVIP